MGGGSLGAISVVSGQRFGVVVGTDALGSDVPLFSEGDAEEEGVEGVLHEVLHAHEMHVLSAFEVEEVVDGVHAQKVLGADCSALSPLYQFQLLVEAVVAVAVEDGELAGLEEPDLVGVEPVVGVLLEVVEDGFQVVLAAGQQDGEVAVAPAVPLHPQQQQVQHADHSVAVEGEQELVLLPVEAGTRPRAHQQHCH